MHVFFQSPTILSIKGKKKLFQDNNNKKKQKNNANTHHNIMVAIFLNILLRLIHTSATKSVQIFVIDFAFISVCQQVHMGTHMWNNTPARRGRRLSVENPIALLGGDALKFSEAFQKDLAARAMNVDQNFWSRYAAAITNGLAMRNNEISVIQSGGVPQLPAITVPTDKASTGNSPPITAMEKTGLERGTGQHFSMMIEDKKDIGIN